ncbi:MAG: hypothetical protein KJ607_12005 [Bacteroidetes bacterium]|nr:hypothetical protein [Bacteroidota bacterium]
MRKTIIFLITVCAAFIWICHNAAAQNKTGSFTDKRDGRGYKTVKIGKQVWMAENLDFKTVAGCWENYDEENNVHYGSLYNWETALNVCPDGWRLPSKSDFENLIGNYGGENKESFTALSVNGDSGFEAPYGGRYSTKGTFYNRMYEAGFWSETENSETYAFRLYFSMGQKVLLNFTNKAEGFSVRCIRE